MDPSAPYLLVRLWRHIPVSAGRFSGNGSFCLGLFIYLINQIILGFNEIVIVCISAYTFDL